MQSGQIAGVDKPVTRLIQGTSISNFKDYDIAAPLLDEIVALGGTTIDTAHTYGRGESERILGRWLDERSNREQLTIITKAAHPNQDRARVTPYDITADLHDSLVRLQTDYIDIYMLHRDDPTLPVGPIVDILNEHLASGKIRSIGVSNWSHTRIEEANAYAAAQGLTPIVVSSPNFSLAVQQTEPWPDCISISGPQGEEARAWYQAQQMPIIAWSSFAGGFFSGRFTPDNLADFADYYDQICVKTYCSEANFQRLARVQHMAEQKGVTPAQIAIAYVLNYPLDLYAIVGCNSVAEFEMNLKASEVRLTTEEMVWLEGGE